MSPPRPVTLNLDAEVLRSRGEEMMMPPVFRFPVLRRWSAPLVAMLMTTLFSSSAYANLDLVFLLDTTGSMGAELTEVKTRVKEIVSTLSALRPGEEIRSGVVAYRDRGEAYLTKSSDLTVDVDKTFRFLDRLTPGGGGDHPEDILSGLDAALKLSWEEGDATERQIFLVADAPPHLDYTKFSVVLGDAGPAYDDLVNNALSRKIIVHTIGCRSLSYAGVQFFRKLAQSTEGAYQHIGRVNVSGPSLADAIVAAAAGVQERVVTTPGARPQFWLHAGSARSSNEQTTLAASVNGPAIHVSLAYLPTREKTGPTKTLGDNGTGKRVTKPHVYDASVEKCWVVAKVPPGLSIAGTPGAAVDDNDRVVVSLQLEPGDVGTVAFKLPRCVGSDAPVHVQIGG